LHYKIDLHAVPGGKVAEGEIPFKIVVEPEAFIYEKCLEQFTISACAFCNGNREAPGKRALHTGIEQVKFRLHGNATTQGGVVGFQEGTNQSIFQNLIVPLDRFVISAYIAGDGRKVDDLPGHLRRNFQKAPKRVKISYDLLGLDFLLEVRQRIGTQEPSPGLVAFRIYYFGQGTEGQYTLQRIICRQLYRREREKLQHLGPSGKQVGTSTFQFSCARAG